LVEVPEEPNARDQNDNDVPTPKKPKLKKSKEEKFEIKKDQLSVLIKSIFDVVGTRQEIWKLSKQECDLIAEPLCSILGKNTLVDKFAMEYGDYVALCVALATIIIPRALIQLKQEKKEKIINVKNIRPAETRRDTTDQRRKNDSGGGNATGQTSASSQNLSTELYSFLPALQ
jgi:hypothetical protein